ncbi:MAG: lasso peptide isopeptide bond-forming cyclase, partial [Vicinamibacterales bacterium]
MSAIGGVLMFGGRVDPEQLRDLGARLERLGPDGGREVVSDHIGMVYRAFHTNAESCREHQPYCWGHQAILCWDGRLDNRDELLEQLRDELRGEDTDAAIVMAAYRRWRRHGIGKLVGDFALAIWDRHDQAVWLARDPVGTRTLYYHVDAERVIWSTDLGALLDVGGVAIDVSDEFVASHLTDERAPGLTPYVGVHAVKP